ncbi:anhydro-N-acetylmuramic acid kinase [bacterium]|nr:anhydro-N-acetylmuramic acid kinase [bacterium]
MTLEGSGWNSGNEIRVFAGICMGSRSRRLKVAILRCRGEGWNLRVLNTDGMTFPSPPENQAELTRAAIHAIIVLAGQVDIPLPAIDAIGLAELPGDMVQLGTLLAERTGATVACRFADRDIAVGGKGEPLTPIVDWLLFRSPKQTRLLVHLGRALRVALLPSSSTHEEMHCFDAAPGTDFLDELTLRLSDGKYSFDPSGHFAVQGRLSESLVNQWTSHPFLLRSPPRFMDEKTFDRAFIDASLSFARELGLSGKDVLCSANHFLARSLKESAHRFLPSHRMITEIITSGGGVRNGFLWKLIGDRMTETPILRSDDIGVPSAVLGAAHAALWAFLAMENLPGNIPALTGASSPRVLGTIIPGSRTSWDRWVCNVADRFELESRRAA